MKKVVYMYTTFFIINMEIFFILGFILFCYYVYISDKFFTWLLQIFFSLESESLPKSYFFWDTISLYLSLKARYFSSVIDVQSTLCLMESKFSWSTGRRISYVLYSKSSTTQKYKLIIWEKTSYYIDVNIPKIKEFNTNIKDILHKNLEIKPIDQVKNYTSQPKIFWKYSIYCNIWGMFQIPLHTYYIQIFETLEQKKYLENPQENISFTRYIGLILISILICIMLMYLWMLFLNWL